MLVTVFEPLLVRMLLLKINILPFAVLQAVLFQDLLAGICQMLMFYTFSSDGNFFYFHLSLYIFCYCSFAYSHRNVMGKNQKLNISVERGQVDSMFRINYTDPWIEGDDKRTSRSITMQVVILYTFFEGKFVLLQH